MLKEQGNSQGLVMALEADEQLPLLDKNALGDAQFVIIESLYRTLPIHVVFWRDGVCIKRTGIVERVDETEQLLTLQLLSGLITIQLSAIIAAGRV